MSQELTTEEVQARLDEIFRRREEEQPAPEEREEDKDLDTSDWEKKGYIPELARLCAEFEDTDERHIYNKEVRDWIKLIKNAKSTKEIIDKVNGSESELVRVQMALESSISPMERNIIRFMRDMDNVRKIEVEVDFI